MSAFPTVAVVIPVYNRGYVVAEAIDSALTQTHPAVEVHIVNDGSTDGTGDILDAIAATDQRVVVGHQPNAGPAAARNRAIAGCHTTWITFLDSDDLLLPDAIERQLAWLDDNPGHAGVMGHCRTEIRSEVSPPPQLAAKLAGDERAPVFQTVLIRRQAIENVGGYDEALRVAEDTDLHWRLVEAGERIGVHEEPIIRRRVFGDNLSYENLDWQAALLEIAHRTVDRKRPEADDG